jgi:hypothetical protein
MAKYEPTKQQNFPPRLIAESGGKAQVLEGFESLKHKSGRGKGNKRFIGR